MWSNTVQYSVAWKRGFKDMFTETSHGPYNGKTQNKSSKLHCTQQSYSHGDQGSLQVRIMYLWFIVLHYISTNRHLKVKTDK